MTSTVLDQESTEVPEREARVRWTRTDKGAATMLALLVVAAAVFTTLQVLERRSQNGREDHRREAVVAAERVAVGLASIDPKNAMADITALSKLGTADFAKRVQANLANQVDLITANEISSTGEVTSRGLVSLKGDAAVVAVALESKVRNKTAQQGEQRFYRMTIDLERQKNGSWLASKVVFVS